MVALFQRRGRRGRGGQREVPANARCPAVLAEGIRPNAEVTHASMRYEAIIMGAHTAHARIRHASGVGVQPPRRQKLDACFCLHLFRLAREGLQGAVH